MNYMPSILLSFVIGLVAIIGLGTLIANFPVLLVGPIILFLLVVGVVVCVGFGLLIMLYADLLYNWIQDKWFKK